MEIKFDIDKIAKYLEKHKHQLEELYGWSPEIQNLGKLNLLSSDKNKDLKTFDKAPYKKRLLLETLISKKLNSFIQDKNQGEFRKLSLWLIKDWGRINSAKDEDTFTLIDKIYQEESPSFIRIASISKVLAFLNPEKNVIYDSRVAYALNWIILKENAGDKFFPIPEGRNSKMSAFDLDVLIRLKNIKNYQPTDSDLDDKRFIHRKDNDIYILKSEAYSVLNKLIKSINESLWADDEEKINRLCLTEMLLFSIADKAIFEDITETLTLNFNDKSNFSDPSV
jgi:hypothetical protein